MEVGEEIKRWKMEGEKKSKDRKINKRRILVECIVEKGWGIYNSNIKEDKEREFTFTGRRSATVINYVIGDKEVRDKIEIVRVEDRVDSDHPRWRQ